jgi:hypothetical protein
MTRNRGGVLTRLVSVTVISALVWVTACEKKPKAGDPCQTTAICATPSSALFCKAGTFVAVDCKGPGGCSAGEDTSCDIAGDAPGDPCVREFSSFCTADRKSAATCKKGKVEINECAGSCKVDERKKVQCAPMQRAGGSCSSMVSDTCSNDGTDSWLTCKDGKFVTSEVCHGPLKCSWMAGNVACDTSVGVPGEPCVTGSRCDTTRTLVLSCQDGELVTGQRCEGPKGCKQGANPSPDCDSSVRKDQR